MPRRAHREIAKYGDRDELLTEAHKRIAANPKKYVNHVYGEHEAGGTAALYLAMGLLAALHERKASGRR